MPTLYAHIYISFSVLSKDSSAAPLLDDCKSITKLKKEDGCVSSDEEGRRGAARNAAYNTTPKRQFQGKRDKPLKDDNSHLGLLLFFFHSSKKLINIVFCLFVFSFRYTIYEKNFF